MPQSTQAKQALTEQEARGEFFKQMHAAGLEVTELRDLVKVQGARIKSLEAMNVGLRSERNTSRTEANAALRAHKDVIAIASDEDWLFRKDSSLKFSSRADGSRILVVRVRGRKILRIRGKVTKENPHTALFKEALEQARLRETGRNKPRRHASDATKARAKRGNKRDGRKGENEQARSGQKQQEESEDAH